MEDVLQHAQPPDVEQIDAGFFLQLAANGRFGGLTELDAPAQRPAEGLAVCRVEVLEDEEIVTTTWHGQRDRAD
jgi:hypothetical protein